MAKAEVTVHLADLPEIQAIVASLKAENEALQQRVVALESEVARHEAAFRVAEMGAHIDGEAGQS